jgi:hypothetical protein
MGGGVLMYVADVTDLYELQELLDEVRDRLSADPDNEQAQRDEEDILDRMDEIEFESTYANKPIPGHNNNKKGTK